MPFKLTKLLTLLLEACTLRFHTDSTTVANARLDAIETTIGTSPLLRIYNGTMPADADAALSGNTLLAVGTLPSDWMAAASSKTKSKAGTWTVTGQAAAGSGTAGTFYRFYDSTGTTCHGQGTFGVNVAINTNGSTAANGNVLNFASTTGVVVGMRVTGTGVATGCTVVAVTSTTVTMSHTSTAGVSNGATITFKYDMEVDNASISSGQVLTVNSFSRTAGN